MAGVGVTLSLKEWTRYRDILAALSQAAADEFREAVWSTNGLFKGVGLGNIPRDQLIAYAYELVAKYSEGSAEAACQFYDAMAALSGVAVPAAVPAPVPTPNDVATALYGTAKTTDNPEIIGAVMGRLVKQTGQDTTLRNAKRDGAKVAWIPAGITCAFCITLASAGWHEVSERVMKGDHAKHIHSNCDCAFAVQFNGKPEYAGYGDGERYQNMYESAKKESKKEGNDTSNGAINVMRRRFYDQNKEEINAQKRAAYARRKELNSSAAEETNVN